MPERDTVTVTFRLPPEKLRDFKIKCLQEGITMKVIFNKAVDEYLAKPVKEK